MHWLGQPLHHPSQSRPLNHLEVLFQGLLPHCDPSSLNPKPSSILLLHEYRLTSHPCQLGPWVKTHRLVVQGLVVEEAVVLGDRPLEAMEVGVVRRCWA